MTPTPDMAAAAWWWYWHSQTDAPWLITDRPMILICMYLGTDYTAAGLFGRHHPSGVCTATSLLGCQCQGPITWRLSGF